MSTIEYVGIGVALLFGLPLLAYLTVKLGTLGYLAARQRWTERQGRGPPRNRCHGSDCDCADLN